MMEPEWVHMFFKTCQGIFSLADIYILQWTSSPFSSFAEHYLARHLSVLVMPRGSFVTIYLAAWADCFGNDKQKRIWLTFFSISQQLSIIVVYILTALLQKLSDLPASHLADSKHHRCHHYPKSLHEHYCFQQVDQSLRSHEAETRGAREWRERESSYWQHRRIIESRRRKRRVSFSRKNQRSWRN